MKAFLIHKSGKFVYNYFSFLDLKQKPWHHHYEDIPILSDRLGNNDLKQEINAISSLGNAIPNPAKHKIQINVHIIADDAINARLVFINMLGEKVFEQKLMEGKHAVNVDIAKWHNGLYTYGLMIKGRFIKTKKLIVFK
ncbi:MAG TPA: T9SS type A sorting domain-containing protein [Edaphocola sp.]|nr:T9SS type A sorting domain-containing protein [Edaphocola sp.]